MRMARLATAVAKSGTLARTARRPAAESRMSVEALMVAVLLRILLLLLLLLPMEILLLLLVVLIMLLLLMKAKTLDLLRLLFKLVALTETCRHHRYRSSYCEERKGWCFFSSGIMILVITDYFSSYFLTLFLSILGFNLCSDSNAFFLPSCFAI